MCIIGQGLIKLFLDMEFIQVLSILCLTFGIYCNDITSKRDNGINLDDAQSSFIYLQTQLMDQTRLLQGQSRIINELSNNVTELQESYRLQEQANKHKKTDIHDLKHQIAKQQFLQQSLQQSGNINLNLYFHCSLLSLNLLPQMSTYENIPLFTHVQSFLLQSRRFIRNVFFFFFFFFF